MPVKASKVYVQKTVFCNVKVMLDTNKIKMVIRNPHDSNVPPKNPLIDVNIVMDDIFITVVVSGEIAANNILERITQGRETEFDLLPYMESATISMD